MSARVVQLRDERPLATHQAPAADVEGEPLLDARDRVLVVGKTGSGKSTRLKAMLAAHLAAGRRVVVFDPHDEYSRDARPSEHVTRGPMTLRRTMDELEASPDVLLSPHLSLAVVAPLWPPEDAADAFESLCDYLMEARDLVFACDEFGTYGEHVVPIARHMATQGRHQGIALAWASQRMTDFHPKVRSQASRLACGLQTHPEDLAALEKLTGRPDFAEHVSRLPLGEILTWRDTTTPTAATPQKRQKR